MSSSTPQRNERIVPNLEVTDYSSPPAQSSLDADQSSSPQQVDLEYEPTSRTSSRQALLAGLSPGNVKVILPQNLTAATSSPTRITSVGATLGLSSTSSGTQDLGSQPTPPSSRSSSGASSIFRSSQIVVPPIPHWIDSTAQARVRAFKTKAVIAYSSFSLWCQKLSTGVELSKDRIRAVDSLLMSLAANREAARLSLQAHHEYLAKKGRDGEFPSVEERLTISRVEGALLQISKQELSARTRKTALIGELVGHDLEKSYEFMNILLLRPHHVPGTRKKEHTRFHKQTAIDRLGLGGTVDRVDREYGVEYTVYRTAACPVFANLSDMKYDVKLIKGGHIVDRVIGQQTLQAIMPQGDLDIDGHLNLIPWHAHVEEVYSDNKVMVIFDETIGALVFKVVDVELRSQRLPDHHLGIQMKHTWGDLHNKPLQFPTGKTPSMELLYIKYLQQMLGFREQFKYDEYFSTHSGYIWRALSTINPDFIQQAAAFIGDFSLPGLLLPDESNAGRAPSMTESVDWNAFFEADPRRELAQLDFANSRWTIQRGEEREDDDSGTDEDD